MRVKSLPEGETAFGAYMDDDWRKLTQAFDGKRLSEACLGGPCWEFPKETLAALLADDSSESAEIWFSADPGASPAALSQDLDRGQVNPYTLSTLEAKN